MTKRILYVSSFNNLLYDVSGKKLLDSMTKYNIFQNADILIGYEGFTFDGNNSSILQFDVMQYKFMTEWLEKFKHVIPTAFGGTCVHSKDKLNQKVYKYWNKKASLWFRKVATLHYAYVNFKDKYDYIVWIDCDAYFIKCVPEGLYDSIFKNFDMFYHMGLYREQVDYGYETGLVGFNKKGFLVLEGVFRCYENGKFQEFRRWDDGYVFKMVTRALIGHIRAHDMVTEDIKGKRLDAINKGAFKDYVVHEKGIHKKLPGLGD